MALGMVRKVHYDIRDGKEGSLVLILGDGQKYISENQIDSFF